MIFIVCKVVCWLISLIMTWYISALLILLAILGVRQLLNDSLYYYY